MELRELFPELLRIPLDLVEGKAAEVGVESARDNFPAEFEGDVDINDALADVRAAVNRARDKYPSEAKEPVVAEVTMKQFPAFVVHQSIHK